MKKFDVVVVGGGIIGCAIACELRKNKVEVAVVEKNVPGAESSSAAAGMLAPHAGPRMRTPFFSLLREALAQYPQYIKALEAETGIDTEYRETQLFYLAFDEEEEQWLAQKREWQQKSGVKTEWVSGEDIRKAERNVGPDVRKGLFFPEDTQIDNVKLVKAIYDWARKLNVQFLIGSATTRVWLEKEKLRGICIGEEKIESPVVINAAGAWSDFDKSLPFEIPVKPARGQILVFHHHPPLFRKMLYTKKVYLVTREDGRIIVGSTVESAGYDKNLTLKGIHKLSRGFMQINPELGFIRFKESWAGLRPRSKDNLPILGKSPVEGLLLATGHFRNGILLAPMTARILTNLALQREPGKDLTPFSVDRFLTQPQTSHPSRHQ